MKPVFSLAQLTALDVPPPDMVSLAHRTGYDYAGVRLLPAAPGGAAYPLMNDPAMLRETIARMEDTGTRIFDLEMIRVGEGFKAEAFLPFLETGAKLGAKAMLVAGDDANEERMTESYASLCDLAWKYGITSDLEFMPWTAVKDLASALRIVRGANRPGCGILVDVLHFARSGSKLEDLDGIPREWLHYAQMCDGPAKGPDTVQGLIDAARGDRLLPGEGELDIAAIFSRLPADLPISMEIPSDRRYPVLGADRWAADVLAAGQATARTFR
ncbi:sugar phosphate isomerase/epimerase family protein [Noviherbaspirillum denitrificans]|uniref:Xylose isomerase n=1 Tax=Noviherbaspirillum denitrificans TaxID=1968433 RepID=A0A254TG87_9BURK|nr:sugar phosphate isomerase/epimerase [Noviherbaspirillum denitrificans]OWW19543.1 xylose isomerase [Noviherbaspirillum denitrificans]